MRSFISWQFLKCSTGELCKYLIHSQLWNRYPRFQLWIVGTSISTLCSQYHFVIVNEINSKYVWDFTYIHVNYVRFRFKCDMWYIYTNVYIYVYMAIMCTVIDMFHDNTCWINVFIILVNRDWALIFFVNREWALIFFVNREQYPLFMTLNEEMDTTIDAACQISEYAVIVSWSISQRRMNSLSSLFRPPPPHTHTHNMTLHTGLMLKLQSHHPANMPQGDVRCRHQAIKSPWCSVCLRLLTSLNMLICHCSPTCTAHIRYTTGLQAR